MFKGRVRKTSHILVKFSAFRQEASIQANLPTSAPIPSHSSDVRACGPTSRLGGAAPQPPSALFLQPVTRAGQGCFFDQNVPTQSSNSKYSNTHLVSGASPCITSHRPPSQTLVLALALDPIQSIITRISSVVLHLASLPQTSFTDLGASSRPRPRLKYSNTHLASGDPPRITSPDLLHGPG